MSDHERSLELRHRILLALVFGAAVAVAVVFSPAAGRLEVPAPLMRVAAASS